jgi:hypothetical protein
MSEYVCFDRLVAAVAGHHLYCIRMTREQWAKRSFRITGEYVAVLVAAVNRFDAPAHVILIATDRRSDVECDVLPWSVAAGRLATWLAYRRPGELRASPAWAELLGLTPTCSADTSKARQRGQATA